MRKANISSPDRDTVPLLTTRYTNGFFACIPIRLSATGQESYLSC